MTKTTKQTLVGTLEVAALLGVSRQRVYQLRAKPDFPTPLEQLRSGPVWDKRDVMEWQAKRSHRHHWSMAKAQQKRLPDGATRHCTVCRATQTKVDGEWQSKRKGKK